jgi:hypothetical protein
MNCRSTTYIPLEKILDVSEYFWLILIAIHEIKDTISHGAYRENA